MAGKQLRLFLVDGTPGGLTTLEIVNWTGRLVSGPRSDLAQLLSREGESRRPGVYLLIGDDETAVAGTRLYVGETDEIAGRLKTHHHEVRGKDFWTRVVTITSKDDNLTKGHTRYLESRLCEIAATAQRCTLENGTAPARPPLPEADQSDMETFIEYVQIALPVLGVNVLRSIATRKAEPMKPAEETVSPVFELNVPKHGIAARAQQVDGEFTLLEGSLVAPEVRVNERYAASTAAAYSTYRAMQERLVGDGSIRIEGANGVLTRNVVFSSPSTAGAIVTGRSCNGRQAWATASGQTFGAWEEREVGAS